MPGARSGQRLHRLVTFEATSGFQIGNSNAPTPPRSTSYFPLSNLSSAYLGPEFSDDEISGLLESRKQEITNAECIVERIANNQELCARTATAIAEGKVVGWFQGRMEWGPRALGNRSILGDPRRADMKDILNAKIKRRESFRPFAPSILREQSPSGSRRTMTSRL